jgi:hypothetical protein
VAATPQPIDPPLSLEPVVGWRVWALERIDGTLRLRSVTRSDHWPPNEAMEAKCDRHQGSTRPSDRCSCGLYAAASPEDLARSGVFSNATVVVGAMAMWGTVVEHTRGARSRFAYPARLRLACGPCLAQGHGAVAPLSVIGSSGSLMVVCRRHGFGGRAPTRPAAEVQAELLSAYGVELLPIERVSRGLRTGASPTHPAGCYVEMALTGFFRLLGFVINAVMVMWIIGWFLVIGGAVIGGILHLFAGSSDVRRAAPPSVAVVIQSPSPAAYVLIMAPRETDEPYRGGLPAPPISFRDIAFLCGVGDGTRVNLVPCTSKGSDLLGFAVLTEPKGARHDCSGRWDAYTRGPHYWICWNQYGEQAFVHRWANAPNPFMIPTEEGGALDEHR